MYRSDMWHVSYSFIVLVEYMIDRLIWVYTKFKVY